MSDLDSIVSVQITVTDKAPTRASFGIPLFADYHTAWLDLIRAYSDPDDMLTDGFTVNSPVYQMALDAKSQNPSITTFKIGRLTHPYTQVVHLIPDSGAIAQGFVFSGAVAGIPFTYTAGASPTAATISTAIAALIDPQATVVATSDSTKCICTASAAGVLNSFAWARGLNIFDATPDPSTSTAADLAAIAAVDNDWYGLGLACTSKAIVLAAAGWIEAQPKEFFPQSGDWDVPDVSQTGDIASALKNASYTRTGLLWHRYIAGGERADAAWNGVQLAADPGSATPAFKTLAGVTADSLRTAESSAIEGKNASWYGPKHGINITFEGKAASGRFLDVTRFVDWLKETIQVDVFTALVNNPKIPFSQNGLNGIGMIIEGGIVKGGKAGGIDLNSPYSVDTPLLADISTSDKALRRANTYKFRCRLSGALHGVTVKGTISV